MNKLYSSFLLFFVLLLGATQQLLAQANVVIYAENGEALQVRLNGELANNTPMTQVRLDNLPEGLHKATITVFTASNSSVLLKRNLFLENGYEFYFNVKQNAKGQYVCSNSNVVAVSQTPSAPPIQVVTPPVVTQPQPGNPAGLPLPAPSYAPNPNVNVYINLGELFGFGMTTNFPVPTNPFPTPVPAPAPLPRPVDAPPVYVPPVYVPGYTGPIGCPAPISDMEFSPLRNSIQKGSFESTRLTLAKNALQGRCFTTSQIRSIMGLFECG